MRAMGPSLSFGAAVPRHESAGLHGVALGAAFVSPEAGGLSAADEVVVADGNLLLALQIGRVLPSIDIAPTVAASRTTPSTNSRNVMAFRES